jgi:hypothetical protein
VPWLDDYERRARLVPGLILVSPIALTVVMFGLRENTVVAATIAALSTFGAPVVLASYVRHRGLELQEELWKRWGGSPTLELLKSAPLARRRRWRTAVERVSGQALPPANAEGRDDEYEAALAIARTKTRDNTRFKLLFEENRNYGYERNLLGLRKLGLTLSGVAISGSATAVLVRTVTGHSFRGEYAVGLLALVVVFVLWLRLPSERRTRTSGNLYAVQLLDATVDLAGLG